MDKDGIESGDALKKQKKAMETKELSNRIYDIVVEEVETIYPQFMKRVKGLTHRKLRLA